MASFLDLGNNLECPSKDHYEKEDKLRAAEETIRALEETQSKLVSIINNSVMKNNIHDDPRIELLSAEEIIEHYGNVLDEGISRVEDSTNNDPDQSINSAIETIENMEDVHIKRLQTENGDYRIELKKLNDILKEKDDKILKLGGENDLLSSKLKKSNEEMMEINNCLNYTIQEHSNKMDDYRTLQTDNKEKETLIGVLKELLKTYESKIESLENENSKLMSDLESISKDMSLSDANYLEKKEKMESIILTLYKNIEVEISDEFFKEGGCLYQSEIIKREENTERLYFTKIKAIELCLYNGCSVDGIPHGKGKLKGMDLKCEGSFMNGKKHGNFYVTDKNESTIECFYSQYRLDLLHGHQMTMYKNGNILYEVYDNGTKLDLSKTVYPTGN